MFLSLRYFHFILTCTIGIYFFYSVGLPKCVSLLIMSVLCVCLHIYFFTGGMYAALWRKVHVMSGVWSFTYRCKCRSYESYPYSFSKCNIFLRYLNLYPSFPFLWSPRYPLWFHMHAPCSVCDFHIRNFCCCFRWRECVFYIWDRKDDEIKYLNNWVQCLKILLVARRNECCDQ
jgi:hypothetical protein